MVEQSNLFLEDDILDQKNQEVSTTKYLIFSANNLLFGIDTENVVEILTNQTITRVPMVPEYVRGVINLRGQPIPLLDMRLKLGNMCETSDCMIVLNVGDTSIGIMVDSVRQIVDIEDRTILPVPTNNAQKYVSRMTSLPDGKGTALMLDCAMLLED